MVGLAVRYGAITQNPVRDIERIEGEPSKPPRSLTYDERVQLLVSLQDDEVAVRRDLPDLVCFMLSPGVRIGEPLGVIWSEGDFDAGTVQISSTVIRVKGEGLLRKEGTKSRAGQRTLPLPMTALAMLRRRPLFPSLVGGLRDPATYAANCARPGGRPR